MPALPPQILVMDQQLELPSSWYSGPVEKSATDSPLLPLCTDDLLSSIDMSTSELSLHCEPDEELSKNYCFDLSHPSLSFEDYDSSFNSGIPMSQAIVCENAAAGIQDDHSGLHDSWSSLPSQGRVADDERLCCDKTFEDVFQVDTQDILSSPTLAALNSEQDCCDLLEDISSIIVKEEYGSNDINLSNQGAQHESTESSPTSCLEHMQPCLSQSQACPAAAPVVPPAGACEYATATAANADQLSTVLAAPSSWPLEKKRRLSDSVTLYDLLISKTSPLQMQVMMNRGEGAVPEEGMPATLRLHPTAVDVTECVLQHKRQLRHLPAHSAADHREPRHSVPAMGGSSSLAALSSLREPRRRCSLPAAWPCERRPSECSTGNYDDEMAEDIDGEAGDGYTSDAGSCSSCSTWTSKDGKRQPQRRRRRSPYFWQYNSQSKGPRGERFELTLAPSDDPHKPVNFTDPVFDPEQHVRIRHVGRARKGDGNDVRPNPRRLVSIGKELAKLNRLMNDVTAPGAAVGGASDGSAGNKPDSKREKNKLASRACRLKKKAQHEANKVKLSGLEQERKELMNVLDSIKSELLKHRAGQLPPTGASCASPKSQPALAELIKELMARHLVTKVAGRTSQFVSEVVAQVEAGDPHGGLLAED